MVAVVCPSLCKVTVTAPRCNPVIAAFYARLRTTGHPGKVALTAAMRKLVTIPNAILRDHRPWQSACRATITLVAQQKLEV